MGLSSARQAGIRDEKRSTSTSDCQGLVCECSADSTDYLLRNGIGG